MATDNTGTNLQVVLIADDDQPTLAGYLRACEAIGLRVASAGVGDDAFELATTGIPGVIALSLASESGLTLLQRRARERSRPAQSSSSSSATRRRPWRRPPTRS